MSLSKLNREQFAPKEITYKKSENQTNTGNGNAGKKKSFSVVSIGASFYKGTNNNYRQSRNRTLVDIAKCLLAFGYSFKLRGKSNESGWSRS